MIAATDRHGFEVLSYAQCLSLIRSSPLGRLAYVDAGAPMVVPVNHLVDGASIVLRTVAGGKLDAAILGHPVAFQVDDHDASRGTGWSVVVRGTANLLEDEERIARYAEALDSWAIAEGSEAAWIRILADEVSGRRLQRAG